MGKPGSDVLINFKEMFDSSCDRMGKDEYLTYYFIAAHPGCTMDDMNRLSSFCHDRLAVTPEQVQVFTPTPSTYSTAMWWCGCDAENRSVRIERSIQSRQKQKDAVVRRRDGRRPV